jgi:hypothetical protein
MGRYLGERGPILDGKRVASQASRFGTLDTNFSDDPVTMERRAADQRKANEKQASHFVQQSQEQEERINREERERFARQRS